MFSAVIIGFASEIIAQSNHDLAMFLLCKGFAQIRQFIIYTSNFIIGMFCYNACGIMHKYNRTALLKQSGEITQCSCVYICIYICQWLQVLKLQHDIVLLLAGWIDFLVMIFMKSNYPQPKESLTSAESVSELFFVEARLAFYEWQMCGERLNAPIGLWHRGWGLNLSAHEHCGCPVWQPGKHGKKGGRWCHTHGMSIPYACHIYYY